MTMRHFIGKWKYDWIRRVCEAEAPSLVAERVAVEPASNLLLAMANAHCNILLRSNYLNSLRSCKHGLGIVTNGS